MKQELIIGIVLLIFGTVIAGLGFAGEAYIKQQTSAQVTAGIKEFQISEAIRKIDFYNTKGQFSELTPDDRANLKSYELQLERLKSK